MQRQHQTGHRPCSFHQQFMRVPPNHTDEQCRDTRHPKFHGQTINSKPRPSAPKANQVMAYSAQNEPPYMIVHEPPPEIITPQQWEYQPMTSTGQQEKYTHEQPDDNNNVKGTFTLDSAAHPTHIHSPPKSLPRVTNLSTRTAANHTTTCTHAGTIQIRLHNKHAPLRVPCVATNSMHSNLLSVRDTALQYGAVLFTPQHGYILNTRNPEKPTTVAVAKWEKHSYKLHTLPTPDRPQALGARTNTPRPRKQATAKTAAKATTPKHTTPNIRQTPALPIKRHQKPIIPPRLNKMPTPHGIPTPSPTEQSFYHWHIVLNHTNLPKIQRMALANTIPLLPKTLKKNPPPMTCSTCPTAKQKPQPHPRKQHDYPVGSYISSDTCGPFTPKSRHGNRHFVTYLDTGSRYLIAFFIPDRSAVKHTTPLAIRFITAQHNKPPIIYRSDNAREFQSNDMNELYNKHGIQYRSNTPYQPQENSLAERINYTIVTATRAALHHSNLDDTYWEDAMRDVIFKYNITLHDTTGQSPYQTWHNQPPTIPRLYAFGQLGTIPNYHNIKKKLETRADPARYMYNTSPTHIVALNARTNQYTHLRSIDFKPYFQHLDPLYHRPQSSAATKLTKLPIPTKITETTAAPLSLSHARQYPDAISWATAHDEELDTLDKTKTIKWMDNSKLPQNTKIIPLKMTYRYKRTDDGEITRYKAGCNVRGDRMQPYTHYNPDRITTYTAERLTIRTIISIAAAHNLKLEQFDISSAFLHEKYKHSEPVYVRQLPRFDGTYKHPCIAGELIGNLYGTPPASHICFDALANYLTSTGYSQTNSDPCLFYRKTEDGTIIITITIDDFFVAATTKTVIDQLYDKLKTRYTIRRLGEPKLFLNWRIHRYPDGAIHISQPHTIRSILEKHSLRDCNAKPTPYTDTKEASEQKQIKQLTPDKSFKYRQTVGELRYLADSTRPDIAHAVSRLATAMQSPTETHWGQLRYLLKYLKGTETIGIIYKAQTRATLKSYADAGFANATDRKSYTGIVHILTGSPLMWQSTKQKTVALSTCEAEYLAASSTAQQTLWLQRLLEDIEQHQGKGTTLHIDNNAAIQVARQSAPTKYRKYIDLRHHFLQDLVKHQRITIEHVPSEAMLADILTKPLKPQQFRRLRAALHIEPPPPDSSCHQSEGDCQTAQISR